MPQFLEMDPVAKDYIVENGSPIESDDIIYRTYFALAIPKNNWLYGATDQGSLLYSLLQKRTGNVEQEFASYAEDAINQQLIAAGYATQVGVKNLSTSRTGTSNQIDVVPTTIPVQSALTFVPV